MNSTLGLTPLVDQFIFPFFILFFFVFGIISFAVGVGLIFNRVRMHEFFGVMNHWVSMRHSTRWLAVPRDTGPSVQRFRYLIGAVFILAAAFSSYVLITQIDVSRIIAALGVAVNPNSLTAWIMECIRWFLVVGSMFAIAAGIMLIFFPETFRAIESHANHWYSFRSHSQGGDTMHMAFDRWIESHPQAMGWVIAVGALVVVIDYGILLFARS